MSIAYHFLVSQHPGSPCGLGWKLSHEILHDHARSCTQPIERLCEGCLSFFSFKRRRGISCLVRAEPEGNYTIIHIANNGILRALPTIFKFQIIFEPHSAGQEAEPCNISPTMHTANDETLRALPAIF